MEDPPHIYYHTLTAEHPAVYRLIRLRALSESPSNFGSTFAREVAFTRETWVQRLKNPSAIVFVASNRAALMPLMLEEADSAAPISLSSASPTPANIWEAPRLEELEASDEWLYGMVICIQSYDNPSEAYLVSFWVAPSARRQGIGEALVNLAVDWARKHEPQGSKFTRVLLGVRKNNTVARRLYERCGFIGESKETPDQMEYSYKLICQFSSLKLLSFTLTLKIPGIYPAFELTSNRLLYSNDIEQLRTFEPLNPLLLLPELSLSPSYVRSEYRDIRKHFQERSNQTSIGHLSIQEQALLCRFLQRPCPTNIAMLYRISPATA